MKFENLDQANEYYIKAEQEKKELKEQLDNQKIVIEEGIKNNETLQKEVDRLKIKNYEYFEQISQNDDNNNTPKNGQATVEDYIYTVDNIIKNL